MCNRAAVGLVRQCRGLNDMSQTVSPLRTYGRIYDQPPTPAYPNGSPRWVVVTTDPNGYNDMVFLTTLAQVFKLNLGESPKFADWGIPARASVMQQIAPDYNMT